MRKISLQTGLLVVWAAILLAVTAQVILAHSSIDSSSPADGDTLKKSPAEVRITFTLAIQPASASMTITNALSEAFLAGEITYNEDFTTISAPLTSELPDGVYIVTVAAVSEADGETFSSSFTFWIDSQKRTFSDYRVLALLVGLMLVVGGVGFFMLKRSHADLPIEPPESN